MLYLYTVDFCSLCVIICINLVACEKYCLDCLCVENALIYFLCICYFFSNYVHHTVCIYLVACDKESICTVQVGNNTFLYVAIVCTTCTFLVQ